MITDEIEKPTWKAAHVTLRSKTHGADESAKKMISPTHQETGEGEDSFSITYVVIKPTSEAARLVIEQSVLRNEKALRREERRKSLPDVEQAAFQNHSPMQPPDIDE